MSKKIWYSLMAVFVIAATVLSACAPTAAAPTQAATTSAPTSAPSVSGTVGVVLPTKDEPRWIQDETRFKDAFTKAGYNVEILFSQGDSAKEKANVEALISQNIKVL